MSLGIEREVRELDEDFKDGIAMLQARYRARTHMRTPSMGRCMLTHARDRRLRIRSSPAL